MRKLLLASLLLLPGQSLAGPPEGGAERHIGAEAVPEQVDGRRVVLGAGEVDDPFHFHWPASLAKCNSISSRCVGGSFCSFWTSSGTLIVPTTRRSAFSAPDMVRNRVS